MAVFVATPPWLPHPIRPIPTCPPCPRNSFSPRGRQQKTRATEKRIWMSSGFQKDFTVLSKLSYFSDLWSVTPNPPIIPLKNQSFSSELLRVMLQSYALHHGHRRSSSTAGSNTAGNVWLLW